MRRGRVVLLDGTETETEEWLSSAQAALHGRVAQPTDDRALGEQPGLKDIRFAPDDEQSEWIGSLVGRVSTGSIGPARAAAESTAAVAPPKMSPQTIADLRCVLEDEVSELALLADEVAESAASLQRDAASTLAGMTALTTPGA